MLSKNSMSNLVLFHAGSKILRLLLMQHCARLLPNLFPFMSEFIGGKLMMLSLSLPLCQNQISNLVILGIRYFRQVKGIEIRAFWRYWRGYWRTFFDNVILIDMNMDESSVLEKLFNHLRISYCFYYFLLLLSLLLFCCSFFCLITVKCLVWAFFF